MGHVSEILKTADTRSKFNRSSLLCRTSQSSLLLCLLLFHHCSMRTWHLTCVFDSYMCVWRIMFYWCYTCVFTKQMCLDMWRCVLPALASVRVFVCVLVISLCVCVSPDYVTLHFTSVHCTWIVYCFTMPLVTFVGHPSLH